ncbi:helix-turn-helix domain-containing protein [Agrobacterium pusense]|uniref:helix-turn-helix domain-containing protein n=1 Tax=Agrobacterium pusense TaxID=648995 RepID=UPI00384A68C6
MTGEEMRSLRLRTGLSQAALAGALGMSRESISRMERGRDTIERRTELALRYIVEIGLPGEDSLERVHQEVADVLADASVQASPSLQRTEKLKHSLEAWMAAGGSEAGRLLIYRAQGVIGQINVTMPHDPMWHRTVSDLTRVRMEWAALRHELFLQELAFAPTKMMDTR